MSASRSEIVKRRGRYGVDAPYVPLIMGTGMVVAGAVRVLRPGGRILILDINATREYEARLRQRAMADVERRSLGPRMWFGGPWVRAALVRARKPL